ncbi:MAG: hypothetical protein R3C60_14385 [Parvularculaceae bacterium]
MTLEDLDTDETEAPAERFGKRAEPPGIRDHFPSLNNPPQAPRRRPQGAMAHAPRFLVLAVALVAGAAAFGVMQGAQSLVIPIALVLTLALFAAGAFLRIDWGAGNGD